MAKKDEVKVVEGVKTEVINTTDNVPAHIKNQSRGNENVGTEDLQLPRIDVLQALSPQINKKKDAYIEGAEPGMLFNTLTGDLYPEGVRITPVSFVKRYLVWVDRKKDAEGGLRGVFDTLEEAEEFAADDADTAKLEVVPTAEHLVLLDDGTEVILSMSKSRMKVSRKLNSLIRLNGRDRFSCTYWINPVDDKSPKGEFKNMSVSNDGFASEEIYKQAEKLYTALSTSGKKQAAANYDNASGVEAEY